MALNPNPMEEDRNAVVHRDIKRKSFKDILPEGKERSPEGASLDVMAPTSRVEEKKKEIISGVGSMKDLKVSLPDEDEPIPFQVESRLVGETTHEAMHFPEQEFGYGIEKRGRRLLTERRAGYEVRVDAHPEKRINGLLTHELRGVKRFHYQAELDVNAGAPRSEYRARVKWAGRKILRESSDVKSLFVASNTIHVTKQGASKATWVRQGNDVIDVKNAPHMSGVISGDHIAKSNYQAEFEFTPTYTTQKGSWNAFQNARRVSSKYRTYKGSGWAQGKYWDDDLVGLIFKAKSKKDFYMLLWEGDERLAGSSRINNLDKYKIDHPTLFVHGNNTVVSGIAGAANDGRGSIDKKKWDDYKNKKGWGQSHARVFRVKDGVIHEVKVKDHRKTKQGWLFGKRQGMRVVSRGKEVTLFLKTGTGWEKAFEFDTAYEAGSFGMCNISQAVLFHKISYQEHAPISGYVPEQGWFRTRKQEHVITKDVGKYITAKAKAKHRKDFYDVTHISLLEDPKTAVLGSISGEWPSGPLVLKTKNPAPDAVLTKTIKKSGYLDIDPSINSPWNHLVVFDGAMELFKDEVADWLKRTGASKVTDYTFDVVRPNNEDDEDWDLIGEENEKLIAWNARVKQEQEEVSIPVYAYEGEKAIPLTEWFGLNEFSVASLEIDKDTFDRFFDSYRIEGTGEALTLIVKTTEWYKGSKVPHLKLNGEVSSLEPSLLEIPSVPEHYEDVLSGTPMYHGHETVRLTLAQMAPLDTTVYATFGNAGDATTNHSSQVNATTGRPLVMTDDQNDSLIVSATPDPREVEWTSNRKEGKGSVNGIRPFLSAARGKRDTKIDITDLAEPIDLIAIDGIDVKVSNLNVLHRVEGNAVVFYSPTETSYQYTKPWAGEWLADTVERLATRKAKTIADLNEPTREGLPENVLVTGIEAVPSSPFIEVKGHSVEGGDSGLIGRYHQREHALRVVSESFEVKGKSQYYQQEQEMEEWRESLVFRLYPGARDIEATIEGRPATYTRLGDNLIFERTVTGPGRILVKHRVGKLEQEYYLKKVHGVSVEVFLDSERLDASGYGLDGSVLTLNEEPKDVETITVRSLRLEEPYGEGREDLGRYHGARIDKEIWFNWGEEGPFPLLDPVTGQAEQHIADIDLTLFVEKRELYDLFEVQEWPEYNGAKTSDTANLGDWKGPTSGYTYLVSTKNQGGVTAKMDPLPSKHIGLSANITIMPPDDDAAGIIFVDAARKEHVVVGWDSGGAGFDGLSVERWTCQNPQEYGAQNLIFTKSRKYNVANFIGIKNPDVAGNILYRSDRKLEAVYDSVAKAVWLKVDDAEPMKIDVGVELGEAQVGLFTLSQADTRFADIERIDAYRIGSGDDSRLSTTVMRSYERPYATSEQRDFTFEMAKPIGDLFDETTVAGGQKIVGREYEIVNTVTDGVIHFHETTTAMTTNAAHTLTLIIPGKEQEVGLPVWVEGETEGPPNIPDVELPPVSVNDAFAVEWVGQLVVTATGRHEFEITANEGVILEVEGKEIYRGFSLKDGKPRVVGIELSAGKNVDFRLRYYENKGLAYMRLRMKEPGGKMRRIPESRFRTGAAFQVTAKKMERYPEEWKLAIDSGDYFFGKEERHLYAEAKTETHALSTGKQVVLQGVSHQGAPLIVRRGEDHFREVYALDDNGKKTHELFESFREVGKRRLLLGVEQVDLDHVKVWRDGVIEPFIIDGRHVVIGAPIEKGQEVVVRHSDPRTYHVTNANGKTVLTFHPAFDSSKGPVEVTYESTERRHQITDRSLQPLRTFGEGMAWIDEEEKAPLARLKVSLSESHADLNKKVVVYVEATDSLGNPIEGEPITLTHPGESVNLTTSSDGVAITRVIAQSGVYLAKSGETFHLETLSEDKGLVILARSEEGFVKAEVRDEQGRFIKEISAAMVYNGIEKKTEVIPSGGLELPTGSMIVFEEQGVHATCM